LFLVTGGNEAFVLCGGEEVRCTIAPADLHSNLGAALGELRIRPRALALTLYARLLASDLFIHGIGGAKYDQITDDIIRRFFAMEPPSYACVSATLRLPLPAFDVTEDDRWERRRRLRDIRFNPHRLGAGIRSAEALIRREAAIAESVRLRLKDPLNRPARRAAFEQIHIANAAILSDRDAIGRSLREQLDELSAKLDSNRVARSREWFFALHPLSRLRELRDALRGTA
jgi:hypothetical protein